MRLLAGATLVTTLAIAAPPTVVISPPNEPGERLEFGGRVLDAAGKPLAGVKVFAYHTDREGLYNRTGANNRDARLQGTATTGADGAFTFSTIRPGAYPGRQTPAHIHLEITAPGRGVQYLEYWFDDDPIVTASHREHAERNREIEIVHPARDAAGAWTFRDDIELPSL